MDGYIARRTNSTSSLGSILDSIADITFMSAVLIVLLPILLIPTGVLIWIALIAFVRIVSLNDFISSHWFSTDMVVRGELVDMTMLDDFAIYDNETIIGLVTYRIKDNECEIMSLDSLREKQGIGTALVNKVIEIASKNKCTKIKLITTNDNINAIRFYQKRGFDMVNLYHNALDISRKLKPSIPLLGDFNILLKHEIEFQMNLSK